MILVSSYFAGLLCILVQLALDFIKELVQLLAFVEGPVIVHDNVVQVRLQGLQVGQVHLGVVELPGLDLPDKLGCLVDLLRQFSILFFLGLRFRVGVGQPFGQSGWGLLGLRKCLHRVLCCLFCFLLGLASLESIFPDNKFPQFLDGLLDVLEGDGLPDGIFDGLFVELPRQDGVAELVDDAGQDQLQHLAVPAEQGLQHDVMHDVDGEAVREVGHRERPVHVLRVPCQVLRYLRVHLGVPGRTQQLYVGPDGLLVQVLGYFYEVVEYLYCCLLVAVPQQVYRQPHRHFHIGGGRLLVYMLE